MAKLTSGLTPRRARLVKGLTLCCIFTLLSSLAFSIWAGLTDGYSAVIDPADVALIQLDAPAEDAVTALVSTDLGNMTFVLYPDEAPQTVQNFISLAESGAYDNTYVFRVEPGVFFSAGAKDEAGTQPAGSGDAEHIPLELSPKLWPLRGALCALTVSEEGGFWKTLTKTRTRYTGSRFLVANSIEFTDELKAEMLNGANEGLKSVAEAYAENGGIPNYSQQVTVFGQLTEGFDVLDAVTGVSVTGADGEKRPETPLYIRSVRIQHGTDAQK